MKSALLWSIPLLPLLISKAFLWYKDAKALNEFDANIRNEFEANGFVVLRNFFDDELEEWTTGYERVFKSVLRQLYDNGHTLFPDYIGLADDGNWEFALGLGESLGFHEIVMRSPGRFEVSVTNLDDALLDLHKVPPLNPVINKLKPIASHLLYTTKDKLRLDNSFIISTPGSLGGKWHSDMEHYNYEKHVPTHVIHVIVPLVDVTADMGPTGFYPGSHFLTRRPPEELKFAAGELGEEVAPTLKVGDIVIFDQRILHRGPSNEGKRSRCNLLLGFAQDWFDDPIPDRNFDNRTLKECGVFAKTTSDGRCERRPAV